MPKKVIIFSFAYYPKYVGGAEVAVKEITDRIGPEDIQFDMITFRFERSIPKYEKIGNVNVYRVGLGLKPLFPLCKLLFPITAFIKSVCLQRKNNYSGVWSIMANRAGFASLFFKTFYPKIKFLLTLQEGDTLDYPEKRMGILKLFLNPLFKKIFTKADAIQAISNFLADWGRNMGAKGEVVVVPNGVDISKFARDLSKKEIDETRTKFISSPDDKLIITTSRLVPKNAVNDVISSLKYLPNKFKFIIIGSGPDLNKLKQLAEKEKVESRVFFLGLIDYSDIPQYLKAVDVFIRPSLTEGMGNSFIEAMAAGIPVIATPVGGIIDFLFDPDKNNDKNPTGLFCNIKDPKSIAENILKITENRELRDKIVKNAKIMAVEKYDWNLIAPKMREIFFKLFK